MVQPPLWRHEGYIDPASGELGCRSYFKGRRCAHVPLTSDNAKALAGYRLIEKDLRSVASWLTRLEPIVKSIETPDQLGPAFHIDDKDGASIARALFVASLTTYGKCFTRCEGRAVQLKREQVAEDFRAIHEQVMRHRHKFAAHSGSSEFEAVTVCIVVPPQKKYAGNAKLLATVSQRTHALIRRSTGSRTGTFIELVQHVQMVVRTAIASLETAIEREEISPYPIEYWIAQYKRHSP